VTDIVDSATRSRMMSSIRSKDTKPELLVRRFLHAAGLRYRLHRRGVPGRPDIVFPSKRIAVFIHGCFWHQHPRCRFATRPVTNAEFWRQKLEQNRARDLRNVEELEAEGWHVFVIWECETSPERLGAVVAAIRKL
jgi:DNA mismatch endonuclease (patch repair protein)